MRDEHGAASELGLACRGRTPRRAVPVPARRCCATRRSSTRWTCSPPWRAAARARRHPAPGPPRADRLVDRELPVHLDGRQSVRRRAGRAGDGDADPRPRAPLRQARAAALLRPRLRRRTARTGCTSPAARPRARCATRPATVGAFVGGSGHVVGRTHLRAEHVDELREWTRRTSRERSRRTPGPRRTTRPTTACRSSGGCRAARAHPRRHRLRQVGHDQRGRGRAARSPATSSAAARLGRTSGRRPDRLPRGRGRINPGSASRAAGSAWPERVPPRPHASAASSACAPTSAGCCGGTTRRSRGTARCTARASRARARCWRVRPPSRSGSR